MWRMPQVAEEIWVVENQTVNKWQGGIEKYKEHLKGTHSVRMSQGRPGPFSPERLCFALHDGTHHDACALLCHCEHDVTAVYPGAVRRVCAQSCGSLSARQAAAVCLQVDKESALARRR